jgi:hypothetical protein
MMKTHMKCCVFPPMVNVIVIRKLADSGVSEIFDGLIRKAKCLLGSR